ncbi:hypothetical protein MFUL124B02_14040 [Myxococcus fulvus 124B02]|nr:hypothetical protein MFUL124B02_14040 [Myxococcus fulvus 124B02]
MSPINELNRRRQPVVRPPEPQPAEKTPAQAKPSAPNRVLRDESLFETPGAKPRLELNPQRALAESPATPPKGGRLDIEAISNMTDPVARNQAITEGYFQLSNDMAGLLGKENANWATFGVWASKQAGVSIRQEDLPKVFMDQLKNSNAWASGLTAGALSVLNPVAPLLVEGLKVPIRDALNRVSDAIADGNKKLFQDIAPEFQRFTETFKGDTKYDAAKVEKYLAAFPPGKENLKAAFSDYAKAMFESDPNKKAELMLAANNRVGVHEQSLIQGEVDRALNAPLKETFRPIAEGIVDGFGNALPFPGNLAYKGAEATGLVDKAIDSVVDALAGQFRQFATEHMMKIGLPNGSLSLGDDITPGRQGSFPEHLRTIESGDLNRLLGQYDKTPNTLRGSSANDWSKFDQRMNYIVDLFRSRQSDPSLFNAP